MANTSILVGQERVYISLQQAVFLSNPAKSGSKATKKIGLIVNSQGKLIDSNEEMCEQLNQAFGEVFTKEDVSDIPEAEWEYSVNGGSGLCDITIDEIWVMQILDKLRDDKAAGADELVPRFLSKIKHQLARPLTVI